MRRIYRSEKNKKDLEDLVGEKMFFIPESLANERHPDTGKKVYIVRINGTPTYIPTGIETPIPYNVFCVLQDIGAIAKGEIYSEDNEFDPLLSKLKGGDANAYQ